MAKQCILVDVSTSGTDLRPQIDWGKCMLCQEQTREAMVDPTNSLMLDINMLRIFCQNLRLLASCPHIFCPLVLVQLIH